MSNSELHLDLLHYLCEHKNFDLEQPVNQHLAVESMGFPHKYDYDTLPEAIRDLISKGLLKRGPSIGLPAPRYHPFDYPVYLSQEGVDLVRRAFKMPRQTSSDRQDDPATGGTAVYNEKTVRRLETQNKAKRINKAIRDFRWKALRQHVELPDLIIDNWVTAYDMNHVKGLGNIGRIEVHDHESVIPETLIRFIPPFLYASDEDTKAFISSDIRLLDRLANAKTGKERNQIWVEAEDLLAERRQQAHNSLIESLLEFLEEVQNPVDELRRQWEQINSTQSTTMTAIPAARAAAAVIDQFRDMPHTAVPEHDKAAIRQEKATMRLTLPHDTIARIVVKKLKDHNIPFRRNHEEAEKIFCYDIINEDGVAVGYFATDPDNKGTIGIYLDECPEEDRESLDTILKMLVKEVWKEQDKREWRMKVAAEIAAAKDTAVPEQTMETKHSLKQPINSAGDDQLRAGSEKRNTMDLNLRFKGTPYELARIVGWGGIYGTGIIRKRELIGLDTPLKIKKNNRPVQKARKKAAARLDASAVQEANEDLAFEPINGWAQSVEIEIERFQFPGKGRIFGEIEPGERMTWLTITPIDEHWRDYPEGDGWAMLYKELEKRDLVVVTPGQGKSWSRQTDIGIEDNDEIYTPKGATLLKWKKVWRLIKPEVLQNYLNGYEIASKIKDNPLLKDKLRDCPQSGDTLTKIIKAGLAGLLD